MKDTHLLSCVWLAPCSPLCPPTHPHHPSHTSNSHVFSCWGGGRARCLRYRNTGVAKLNSICDFVLGLLDRSAAPVAASGSSVGSSAPVNTPGGTAKKRRATKQRESSVISLLSEEEEEEEEGEVEGEGDGEGRGGTGRGGRKRARLVVLSSSEGEEEEEEGFSEDGAHRGG